MPTVKHTRRATLSGAIESVDLTLGEHNQIIVTRPTLWRPQTAPLTTAPGSPLLLPGPWNNDQHPIPSLLAALHHAASVENGRILIVGHDEPTAAVGQPRADAASALLNSDRAAWVKLATDHGSLLDIHGYLRFLHTRRGWPCDVQTVDGLENEASASAVSSFQAEYNQRHEADILVDGICGEQTLGAIFDVLDHEMKRWLEKHGLPDSAWSDADVEYLSAETGLPSRVGFDGGASGGVDILVGETAWMDLEALTAKAIYTSEVLQWEDFRVPDEPGGWEIGTYTAVTDLTPEDAFHPETYVLFSTDGSYERSLRLPDDAVDTGLYELRWDDLPTGLRYSLRVDVDDAGSYVVFEDRSYPELHLQAVGALDPAGDTDG